MIMDANVHVGSAGISGCKDKQDWAGKMLLSLLKDEGIILLNDRDLCKGMVTRVDPRNGTESSIDLALCTSLLVDSVKHVEIDEAGQWKLRKYTKNKVTATDHNTMISTLKFDKDLLVKQNLEKRYNVRNDDARRQLQLNVNNNVVLENLFRTPGSDVNN